MTLKKMTVAFSTDPITRIELTYHWLVLNDGGDLKLLVVEYAPDGSPPDIIADEDTPSEAEARKRVRDLLRRNLFPLIQGAMTFTDED